MFINYLALFFVGTAIGSFLNVISLRYKPGKKLFSEDVITGRSHCPHCRKILKWYELVPVFSFIIQKGKCRHCKHKLSWQYPLIETLSGLIFIFIPIVLGAPMFAPRSIIWILIFFIFILIGLIDFRHYIIPDQLNFSLAILGLFLISIKEKTRAFGMFEGSFMGHYSGLFGLRDNIWVNHFFAALLGMLFFGLIIVLSRGRAMGWGDFKLVGPLGFIFGWPDILMIIFLSFIIGSVFVAPLLIKGVKKMKDVVPFGPFLIIASSLTFFFGYQIIDGYFSLFGV
ncbi:MAG: prepilin peptidase [Patescibacteria group bacterium]|nr:prepilin peptidase [Patescibacteria group bacterium]